MTLISKIAGLHAGRHARRSTAAVATHSERATSHGLDSWQVTGASRTVVASTTQEWNALRHAC